MNSKKITYRLDSADDFITGDLLYKATRYHRRNGKIVKKEGAYIPFHDLAWEEILEGHPRLISRISREEREDTYRKEN